MKNFATRCRATAARLVASFWFLSAISGCALLGKSEVLSPRYFSPEASGARSQTRPALTADAPVGERAQLQLRLGRVSAAPYLGERIVFRESEYELGFYEERRWTEKPGAYLKRALSQAFYEEHSVRRIVSGPGPTLEVELTELAEVRRSPPMARVRANYVLYDHRLVRSEATITVELPVDTAEASGSGEGNSDTGEVAVVKAMSEALDGLVQRIVGRVMMDLQAISSAAQDTTGSEDASASN